MSEKPLYVQLAQLENQHLRDKISRADYITKKWEILGKFHARQEVVMPLFKDKHAREIRDSQKMFFCYVPPSPFIYGAANGYGELKSGIYMGKYPVKVKEFLSFVQDSGWDYPQAAIDVMSQYSPNDNCPACNISWQDAKEYCRWLRKKTGEYYSLPREVEWEYTARGIDGRPYPWGYRQPDQALACYSGNPPTPTTVPTGSYPENKTPFGCMDMIGNIWEWCVDEFDDPNDPHVLRGGAFCHGIEYVNCVARIFCNPPNKRFEYAGIRVIYLPGEMLTEYQRIVSGESDYGADVSGDSAAANAAAAAGNDVVDGAEDIPTEETVEADAPKTGLKVLGRVD